MLWGRKEVVDEVDLTGFLLGRGMVFENRGDGDGEGIQAADLLGQFEGCEVELRLAVGARQRRCLGKGRSGACVVGAFEVDDVFRLGEGRFNAPSYYLLSRREKYVWGLKPSPRR